MADILLIFVVSLVMAAMVLADWVNTYPDGRIAKGLDWYDDKIWSPMKNAVRRALEAIRLVKP